MPSPCDKKHRQASWSTADAQQHNAEVIVGRSGTERAARCSFADETALRLPVSYWADSQGSPLAVWAADLEGDGDPDLQMATYGPDWEAENDMFHFFVNLGDGTYVQLSADQLPPTSPEMTPVDLDGDGRLDFVFVRGGGVPQITMAI